MSWTPLASSVSESYTRKIPKEKPPDISARGFVYFCEVRAITSCRPCHPCRPYRQQRLVSCIVFRQVGNHALGGDHQAATEAAYCRAERVTLVGSRIPYRSCCRILQLLRCNRSCRRAFNGVSNNRRFFAAVQDDLTSGASIARSATLIPTFWSSFYHAGQPV